MMDTISQDFIELSNDLEFGAEPISKKLLDILNNCVASEEYYKEAKHNIISLANVDKKFLEQLLLLEKSSNATDIKQITQKILSAVKPTYPMNPTSFFKDSTSEKGNLEKKEIEKLVGDITEKFLAEMKKVAESSKVDFKDILKIHQSKLEDVLSKNNIPNLTYIIQQ